jgi:hypothetical protein
MCRTIQQVQGLTEQLISDLEIAANAQHHAKVKQHKYVQLLVDHLCESNIFDFSSDKLSDHAVIDLYRCGLCHLAGQDGGHAKHLACHILCFQTRHDNQLVQHMLVQLHPPAAKEHQGLELEHSDQELMEAQDSKKLDHSITEPDEELLEMVQSISNGEY